MPLVPNHLVLIITARLYKEVFSQRPQKIFCLKSPESGLPGGMLQSVLSFSPSNSFLVMPGWWAPASKIEPIMSSWKAQVDNGFHKYLLNSSHFKQEPHPWNIEVASPQASGVLLIKLCTAHSSQHKSGESCKRPMNTKLARANANAQPPSAHPAENGRTAPFEERKGRLASSCNNQFKWLTAPKLCL